MSQKIKKSISIAVGAARPNWQELSPELMKNSAVYVDSYTSAKNESGDVILSDAKICGEIGEVLLGRKEALKNQRTIFKSMGNVLSACKHNFFNAHDSSFQGMAIEDAVSAQIVYQNLRK
jgi:ornithine cyclodeaminase/alanine dehydrogenase-like protein (mu-crystallin family)